MPIPSPVSKLSQVPIFRGLPEAALQEIYRAARTRRVEKEGFFFQQGDPATHFYVLTAGRVKMSQVTEDGQQVILRVAGAWQMIGGVALLSDDTYPVSAEAVEDSQALSWDTQTLADLTRRYPLLAMNTIRFMTDHVRETQDQLRQLATEKVERRLARVLLRLVRQLGKKVEAGVLIDFPLSRQDLAEMSGTTLFTVSRTFSKWEKEGIIEAGRERVIILKPHGLVTIAEDFPERGESLE